MAASQTRSSESSWRRLALHETTLALELADLEGLVPACSAQIGSEERDVRGVYHPRWVGHRTLASTEADMRRF